jgi:hypothetical protein
LARPHIRIRNGREEGALANGAALVALVVADRLFESLFIVSLAISREE